MDQCNSIAVRCLTEIPKEGKPEVGSDAPQPRQVAFK